ncbi:hypothetical protein [Streptomyces sp. NPDC059787]|uniref:SCO2400 family protein n=1 Tax=Streptomyces sp. NPDC059787 TaxID=3346947 RepID=UPI0036562D02
MDFCHPCRRHLNGALACPGCGTPVETLRAQQRQEPAGSSGYEGEVHGTEEVAGVAQVGDGPGGYDDGPRDDGPRGRRADRRRGREPGPNPDLAPDPAPDPDEAPVAGESRRDRKAAAHRRRRNRTLLIAAGLVLAVGGLSLAELGLDAPGSAPKPAAAGEETTDGGATKVEPTESASGGVTDAVAPGKSPGAKPSDSPSASGSPTGEESEEAEDETEQDSSSAPATPSTTDPTTPPPPEPSADPETPEPDPDPTTKEPEPEPEPTETCDRFLWWCT